MAVHSAPYHCQDGWGAGCPDGLPDRAPALEHLFWQPSHLVGEANVRPRGRSKLLGRPRPRPFGPKSGFPIVITAPGAFGPVTPAMRTWPQVHLTPVC